MLSSNYAEFRMSNLFALIGEQLLRARREKGLSQAELALRIGRNQARVSELERALKANRMGRDRLTLFADICDALRLVPVLVPRSLEGEVRSLVEGQASEARPGGATRAFDELFVDLGDDEPS